MRKVRDRLRRSGVVEQPRVEEEPPWLEKWSWSRPATAKDALRPDTSDEEGAGNEQAAKGEGKTNQDG